MRSLALALAVLLAWPCPPRPRTAVPRWSAAGRSTAAPILEPGSFHDTILPGEYLYYGFRVAAGQRLRVELTHPDIDNEDVRDLGVIFLSGNVHSPTRTLGFGTSGGDNAFISFGNLETKPLVVTSAEAGADEDDDTSGVWKSAGVYYLALHAVWSGNGTRPKAEIPFTFTADGRRARRCRTRPRRRRPRRRPPRPRPRRPRRRRRKPRTTVQAPRWPRSAAWAGSCSARSPGIARRGRRR